MPNGSVRMVWRGMTGTRRVERCRDREPWSPMDTVSLASSRSPQPGTPPIVKIILGGTSAARDLHDLSAVLHQMRRRHAA